MDEAGRPRSCDPAPFRECTFSPCPKQRECGICMSNRLRGLSCWMGNSLASSLSGILVCYAPEGLHSLGYYSGLSSLAWQLFPLRGLAWHLHISHSGFEQGHGNATAVIGVSRTQRPCQSIDSSSCPA